MSNIALNLDEVMKELVTNIALWEYSVTAVRWVVANPKTASGCATGLGAFVLAIRWGLFDWLSDGGPEDHAGVEKNQTDKNATIADIVGEDNARAFTELMVSDLESLTNGQIGVSSQESDGHHTPEGFAKRLFNRWRPNSQE